MPAPDLETIFDPEEAVEAAAKAVLASYGIPAFMQRETENLPGERVDIQLQLGPATGHRGQTNPGQQPGQFVRDAWSGRLTLNIFTKRVQDDGHGRPEKAPRDTHGKMRARVRIACEFFAAKFTSDVLPYHALSSIEPAGTDPTVNVEDDLDVSAVHFDVVVSVRSSAWPVA